METDVNAATLQRGEHGEKSKLACSRQQGVVEAFIHDMLPLWGSGSEVQHKETKCFCCEQLGHLARMCKIKGIVPQKQLLNLVRNTLVEQTSQPTGTDECSMFVTCPLFHMQASRSPSRYLS